MRLGHVAIMSWFFLWRCNNHSTAEVTLHQVRSLQHPRRKSEAALRKLDVGHTFESSDDMKQEICKVCSATVSNFGYVRHGHGWKGRQELIDCNEDVKDMYALYGKRTDIFLWCHTVSDDSKCSQSRKRLSLTDGEPVSKRAACAQMLTEV